MSKEIVGRHFCMNCESMEWFKRCECDTCSKQPYTHKLSVCDHCNSSLDDSRARELLEDKCITIQDLRDEIVELVERNAGDDT